jgi:hypothetical protein
VSKNIHIDLDMAADILEILGSVDDPIEYNGRQTSIDEIVNDLMEPANSDARKVHIKFFGSRGKQLRRRNGTVYTMILDRLGAPATTRAPEPRARRTKSGRQRDAQGRFLPGKTSRPKRQAPKPVVNNGATLARHILMN